jgi:hypothetical protein
VEIPKRDEPQLLHHSSEGAAEYSPRRKPWDTSDNTNQPRKGRKKITSHKEYSYWAYNLARKSVMKPLLSLLKNDPAQVDSLSVEQVLALCGNGKLNDASDCSRDFREYLQIATSSNLFEYLQTCLQGTADRGRALQDVVNELGRRLDYSVENGLYQGKVNAIGFDGLWSEPNGHTLVIEVKTSDAYRINLDTISDYRDELIRSGRISSQSSILLVVGRQDTGDLEAQVRGSRHAWTVRIISADALAKLVKLKETTELASAVKIHELLVPFEYTRLDRIVDIAFTVADEASDSEVTAEIDNTETETVQSSGKQRRTAADVIEQVRSKIVVSLSKKYVPLVKKSKALYWSADKTTRAAITISKEYEKGGFWYAYHPAWDEFLSSANTGFPRARVHR